MTPNATLAGAVLGRLAGLGVVDYVVCAGARNVPLVASLLERCQDLKLRVWHHFDERAAAFFALGLAKGTGEPVAVLTTSGTAVAELLPAAIEGYYSGIPLVWVTADRPVDFRGSGSPQAIEQAGIFGPYAMALDVEAVEGLTSLTDWTGDAPLHLNVCFDEPRADDRNASWGPEAPVAERANVPTGRPDDAHPGSVAASATADAFIVAPVAERANVPTERPDDAHPGSVAASATADAFIGAPVAERANVPTERPDDAHPGSVAADAFIEAPVAERANVPTGRPDEAHPGSVAASATAFCSGRDGLLVLLGELPSSWRPSVESFLVSLGAPVWAEATSGLRESPALAALLRYGEPALPQKILRIGGVPSLRLWRDLETNPGIPALSICRRPFSGLARPSQLVVTSAFPALTLPTQGGQFPEPTLSNGGAFARFPRSEPALVHDLSRWIPSHALVYLGNSLPIREWNRFATIDPPHPHAHASRGAKGIDGQVATFLGLSNGAEESWGLFGDLTALYDLNAPALLSQLAPGKRRIVVINNGGGRIFSRLPSMAGMAHGEKQVTENRHRIGFEAWASMWGVEYRFWRAGEAFPEDLPDTVLIEAVPDEDETEASWNWGK
ncbi:MAG: thiamine pyrophosphate-binding protein [Verrucomicrobiales bacterium]|nr:thiamine pyrophosphate-binding protein [Verrucomicrobiales bacterium]